MLRSRFMMAVLWMGAMVLGSQFSLAQNYPARPIRMLAAEPGSGADFTARLIAQGISGPLGQQVIVDNRPSGVIVGESVAKAQADGYTLLVTGSSLWLTPLVQAHVPYDTIRDFAPIAIAVTSPQLLVVHPSLPVKSVKDLIVLAKGRPGELNYGVTALGSPNHLAGESFKLMAGVDIVRISYKGGGQVLNALMGGEVHMMFSTATAATPYVNSRRLKGLAVTSPQPSALAPGMPTMAASGVPGYEWVSLFGVFAPARTSAAIIKRLNDEIVRALGTADVKQKFLTSGSEVVGSSPEEFGAKVQSEIVRVGKLIKDAGINLH